MNFEKHVNWLAETTLKTPNFEKAKKFVNVYLHGLGLDSSEGDNLYSEKTQIIKKLAKLDPRFKKEVIVAVVPIESVPRNGTVYIGRDLADEASAKGYKIDIVFKNGN